MTKDDTVTLVIFVTLAIACGFFGYYVALFLYGI